MRRSTKQDLQKLLQAKAYPPSGQDRVERPAVEVSNDGPLKQIPGRGADEWSQRQRQPEAAAASLNVRKRECTDGYELPVGHVDDAHQTKDYRQPKSHQGQNANQSQRIEDYRRYEVHGMITGNLKWRLSFCHCGELSQLPGSFTEISSARTNALGRTPRGGQISVHTR